jgi:hypothetical protein
MRITDRSLREIMNRHWVAMSFHRAQQPVLELSVK